MSRERAIEPRSVRISMGVVSGLVLLFLYVPLLVIVLYAFNPARSQSWPLPGLSTRWIVATWENAEVRTALVTSLKAGFGATSIALILGSLAAFAVHRFRFFGRETVSFLLILPLALPGIVTGMALNSTINLSGQLIGVSFSLWTTFALSFDEIIVTNFTSGSEITLPKWIFNNLRLPNQRPVVNVVASVLLIASLIPVYIAQRLTQESGGLVTGRGAVVPAIEDAGEQPGAA